MRTDPIPSRDDDPFANDSATSIDTRVDPFSDTQEESTLPAAQRAKVGGRVFGSLTTLWRGKARLDAANAMPTKGDPFEDDLIPPAHKGDSPFDDTREELQAAAVANANIAPTQLIATEQLQGVPDVESAEINRAGAEVRRTLYGIIGGPQLMSESYYSDGKPRPRTMMEDPTLGPGQLADRILRDPTVQPTPEQSTALREALAAYEEAGGSL